MYLRTIHIHTVYSNVAYYRSKLCNNYCISFENATYVSAQKWFRKFWCLRYKSHISTTIFQPQFEKFYSACSRKVHSLFKRMVIFSVGKSGSFWFANHSSDTYSFLFCASVLNEEIVIIGLFQTEIFQYWINFSKENSNPCDCNS